MKWLVLLLMTLAVPLPQGGDTPIVGPPSISYETVLRSPAPEAELRKLIEAVESHCPVLDTLVRPIEVTGRVTINDAVVA